MPSKAQLHQEMQCTDTAWMAGSSREPEISKMTHECKRICCWLYNCVHAYSSKSHWLKLSCSTPIVQSTFTFPPCVCVCIWLACHTNNLLFIKLFCLSAFIWSADTVVFICAASCQGRLVSWDCLLPLRGPVCHCVSRHLISRQVASQ